MMMRNIMPESGLVAVIGGGGKTGLLEAVEKERHQAGLRSLVTVTTRLGRWQFPGLAVVEAGTLETALQALFRAEAGERVLLAGPPDTDDTALNKYNGIPLAWYPRLRRAASVDTLFLVEADGSTGLPLKAHRDYEPVLPPGADFIVAVAGLSVLLHPWPGTVHRPEILARYISLPDVSSILTPAQVASFIKQAWSGFRPDLIFLNQADLLTGRSMELGNSLAGLLDAAGFRVIVASLREGWFRDCDFSFSNKRHCANSETEV